ncbi:host-nuclease inhibitor Gam family protein [Shouchella patagoniensis]|uniref:host-nuclease inhibitor Gam family protein n=1 Tax=Shouchella patagoniensis TaxID=228576 RepID=UPI0009957454|nr:host-nuclease inhibitor Gam family protein [Shouchella patagoniensis]
MNAFQQAEIEELEEHELSEETKERFSIKDQEGLNWAFRKMAAYQQQIQDTKAIAAREIERVTMWSAEEVKPLENSISFFEFLIKEYHMKQLEENPKQKTLKSPHGKSKSITKKPDFVAMNQDSLLEHIEASGLDTFIKKEVRWGDFKKTLNVAKVDGQAVIVDALGQRVEGVEMDQGGTTFKVEV